MRKGGFADTAGFSAPVRIPPGPGSWGRLEGDPLEPRGLRSPDGDPFSQELVSLPRVPNRN